MEYAPDKPEGDHVFNMPHKPVIRELAEMTKIRITYDASARENQKSLSLNDCLHVGPPLQLLLVDVILRKRLKPIALTEDVKQAFHQIWIDKKNQDVFHFYCVSGLRTQKIITFRLTRDPFDSAPCPSISGGNWGSTLIVNKNSIHELLQNLKRVYMWMMSYLGMIVRSKWPSSNLNPLKYSRREISVCTTEHDVQPTGMQTYAKETLGTAPTETKMLGLSWNKTKDTLEVRFKACKSAKEMTKREMLRAMAKVFDPIGLVSPIMLNAKRLCRETCEMKHTWDGPLQKEIECQWIIWLRSLPGEITIPRSITCVHEKVIGITLHGFGDANKKGCSIAIYAVVQQTEEVLHGLLASKSRIAKKDISMANICTALGGYSITGVHGWLDSTVAPYWIKNNDQGWKQFVSNRDEKIIQKTVLDWRYCPTKENPTDEGTRGAETSKLDELWWKGLEWQIFENNWSEDITLEVTDEVREEARMIKGIHVAVVKKKVFQLQMVLRKHSLWKTLRITAWVIRYLFNTTGNPKRKGALQT